MKIVRQTGIRSSWFSLHSQGVRVSPVFGVGVPYPELSSLFRPIWSTVCAYIINSEPSKRHFNDRNAPNLFIFFVSLHLIRLGRIHAILASCLIYSYAFKEYISSFGCWSNGRVLFRDVTFSEIGRREGALFLYSPCKMLK